MNLLFMYPGAPIEGRKFRTGSVLAGCAYDFNRRLLVVAARGEHPKADLPCHIYYCVPPSIWRAFPTGLTAFSFYHRRIRGVYGFMGMAMATELGLDPNSPDLLPQYSVMEIQKATNERKQQQQAEWQAAAAFGKKPKKELDYGKPEPRKADDVAEDADSPDTAD